MGNEEANSSPQKLPFVCNVHNLDHWIRLLLISLIPPTLFGTWAVGVYSFVFAEKDLNVLREFYNSTLSLTGYMKFCFQMPRAMRIVSAGVSCLVPIIFTSCLFSFITDRIFSNWRKRAKSNWWIVTGLLFALAMPPTIPIWMVAVGIIFGTIFGKEIFGGTGMNMFNPALVARCFLVLSFPGNFCGNVWIAPTVRSVQASILSMDALQNSDTVSDAISGASPLGQLALTKEVLKDHLEAIAYYIRPDLITPSGTWKNIFNRWSRLNKISKSFDQLSIVELESFLTSHPTNFGLGLDKERFIHTIHMAKLYLGEPPYTTLSLLIGARPGCCGEVGLIGPLIGAFILLWNQIASGLIMVSIWISACLSFLIFKWIASIQQGTDMYAKYVIPLQVHLMTGSLAFGSIFFATDPVSAPCDRFAKIIYGGLIGFLIILVRLKSSAFKEGVMFAILIGNVFAPILDIIALELRLLIKRYRSRRSEWIKNQ
ncbi:RnfABCDGE type electron transport complex subunit D [Candidatus Similichlamydia epinepheli]|uniref:RnfABCDGE type electron transport complex subunit D n=1 Tax=Candidatus Similichlamydia epinepheli TaxID=1903953 RepID=UPI0013008CBD|nr:RnfABCDGE type electron transport complex subunit D [Candidatus Similichlamydia epinepheli]